MCQIVAALPRLIELAIAPINRKEILRCVKEEGELKGFLQFRGEQVGSADAKFEVQSSTNGNGLVHIRSCYNNKYLVLNEENNWIAAKAEKPEEDQSKRSCTLLRPTCVDGDPKKIRLTHVHLKSNLSVALEFHDDVLYYLATKDEDSTICDLHVIDWQSLVILPKYVAFKGDNDKFLRPNWQEKHYYLQFWDDNMEDGRLSVGNEIVQAGNGNIKIRNLHWNRYWRLSPAWIWADTETSESDDTLFEPVKISDGTIVLRNVKNNLFCTRLTSEGKEDCLNAGSDTITRWAKLKVSEFVISSKIENINFRLKDARIYGESVVVMVVSSYINSGSVSQEQTFELSYTDKTTSTWNWNLSMKASFETTFKTRIPVIKEGEIKMGVEIGGGHAWGGATEAVTDRSTTYKVSIPPKTHVTVRIMATRGTCDVPYSYTQRAITYTGETLITEMDDGVYTGVNNYSYHTELIEESLTKDPNTAAAGLKKVDKVSLSDLLTPI